MIRIAIDAMGGDRGPSIIVPAALEALRRDKNLELILVGREAELNLYLNQIPLKSRSRLSIHPASQIVEMDESPALALRAKKDSSMRVAINLVKEGKAQACVSAGNTGALMAIARFVLKTISGVERPAIVYSMPTTQQGKKIRILDLGANVDSSAEHLLEFGLMGSILASALDQIEHPKVALLNIGKEAIKGNEQVKKAASLFAKTQEINYIGYIEGDDLYQGVADVVVCDGFVGNVVLKTTEGTAKLMITYLKQAFKRTMLTRLAAFLVRPILKSFAKQIDPGQYNGASFLGLQGIVIKSHGSADRLAFTRAIHEAAAEVRSGIAQRIQSHIEQLFKSKSILSLGTEPCS